MNNSDSNKWIKLSLYTSCIRTTQNPVAKPMTVHDQSKWHRGVRPHFLQQYGLQNQNYQTSAQLQNCEKEAEAPRRWKTLGYCIIINWLQIPVSLEFNINPDWSATSKPGKTRMSSNSDNSITLMVT